MTPRSTFQRFAAELRRRHVPQTVAVYAVAAWAAIQFADVVVPNLGWSQGVVTAVIIAAAIGLPVVTALAWILEWGPEGIHRTESTPEDGPEEGAGAGAEAGSPAGGRGTPVEPRSSYAPWAAAVGVLTLGIAGALVWVALADGGAGAEAEEARTRSERRQEARGPVAAPPVPPSVTGPGFADSLARSTSDSVLQALGREGLGDLDMTALIEMATRIGEASARVATGGPVEILEPETWRYGAPHPTHPGDTLVIRGVARAEQGVVAVEVDGRVVARSEEGAIELPFRAVLVPEPGRGFRSIPVIVRVRDGDPLERRFAITLVPRDPEG